MMTRAISLVFPLLFSLSHSFSQSLDKKLVDVITKNFKSDEPGGAIRIMKNGQEVFSQGFGIADLQTGEKISPQTVFNTGSISKTFVATGILILASEGKIRLDDPITKYFNFDHPDVVDEITIQHFLSHTSGIPDLRNVSADPTFYLTAKDTANFQPLLATQTLNFPAGSKFQYSNPAYNGLALIIEKVSGMKWQAFVEKNIFDKANMQRSTITDGAHPSSGVAHAYNWTEDHWQENDYGEFPTFAAAGNGGIWSTVEELAAYESALSSSKILPLNWLKMSRTIWQPNNWASDAKPHIGYGWWLGEGALFPDQSFGKDMVFHTGSQGGFRGFHIVMPDEQIFVAALFNRPVGRDIVLEIFKALKEVNWLN